MGWADECVGFTQPFAEMLFPSHGQRQRRLSNVFVLGGSQSL